MPRPARFRTAILCLALLTALGSFTACASSVTIYVRGVAPLNMNEEGESLPVAIRIYQFLDEETAKKFKTEPFETIWTDDATALGDGLLKMKEIAEIIPGGPNDPPMKIVLEEEKEEYDKNARYIGVMALIGTENDENKPRREYKATGEVESYIFNITGYWIEVVKR